MNKMILLCVTGQTPHQCEYCGKKYTRKEHLANHMRSHTNDTPFRCEICGKSFGRKEHFTNHILWHTGIVNICKNGLLSRNSVYLSGLIICV